MPAKRKPTLSPSKITTYLACPAKYSLTYLDPRGRWYLKSKSYYSFGSTLHKVLERFHDANDTGVTTVGDAMKAYEEGWIDAGYSSAEEMAEAFGEGKELLLTTTEEDAKRKSDLGIVTLFVERSLRLDLGDFVLTGRLDRVDQYPDGTLEIIDYKTGNHKYSVEELSGDIAMSCYQLMLKAEYPDNPVTATIFSLRHTENRVSYQLPDSDLEVFRQDLIVLGKEILAVELGDKSPSPKPICPHCDFLPLCSKHPNFA